MENSAENLLLIAHLLSFFRPPLGAAIISDCPHECVCVNASSHVTCHGVGLTSIPVDRLPGNVASLDLSRNRLTAVDSLGGLRRVVELRLAQNNIGVLHRGSLNPAAATLEVIDLSKNNLTKLEPGSLSATTHLLHVDLSENQLQNVDGAFSGLRQLSRLDLRRNRLTRITSNSLPGLSNLRYLRLDENRISSIESRAFVTLDRLMYLVLRGNRLGASVSRFHFSSEHLSYVDLSDCGLERFPGGLPSSVRYLQLRNNLLQTLTRQNLDDMSSELNILVLDENRLEYIDSDTFQTTTNLEQLWLNGNQLLAIPRSLPLTLQRLFIDSNRLQSLTVDDFPRPPSGIRQLSTLSAMSNNISFVGADALASLPRLSSLDLADNRIRKLYSDTFTENGRLRMLTLSKNPLEVIGARCMKGLDQLETFSLAYIPTSKITVADDAFGEELPNLRKLDLTNSPGLVDAVMRSGTVLAAFGAVQDLVLLGSRLESLSEEFLDVFRGLVVLHLSSDRWRCDSSMLWFRNWLLATRIHLEPTRDHIICAAPRELRGRAITSLADEDLRPLDSLPRQVRRRRPPPSTAPVSRAAISTSPDREPETDDNRMFKNPQHRRRTHASYGSVLDPTTSGSTSGSRARDRIMLIIVMTILVTVLAAVAILAVIVYTCRTQTAAKPVTPVTARRAKVLVSAQNVCADTGNQTTAAGRRVVYFVASGDRSSSPEIVGKEVGVAKLGVAKSDAQVEACDMTDGHYHRVTLLTQRHGGDERHLRSYKWEDF